MTFPDDPNLQNIEPPLPELSALRGLAQSDQARTHLRNAIRSRVRRTLHDDTHHDAADRRFSRPVGRPLLIAAAVAATVPGALAATATGRTWLSGAVDSLPWITNTEKPSSNHSPKRAPSEGRARSVATPTGETASAPSVSLGNFNDAQPLAEAPPAVSSAAAPAHKLALRVNAAGPNPSTAVASTEPSTPTLTSSAQLQAERKVLESARRALALGDYADARFWCTQHRSQFSTPILEQERGSIEAMLDAASATPKPTRP